MVAPMSLPPWTDALAAGVLTALGVLITLSPENGGGTTFDTVTVAACTLPVAWRRRAPLATAWAFAAGVILSGAPTFQQVRCGVAIPAGMLIAYAVATRCGPEPARQGLAVVLAAMVALTLTDSQVGPDFLVLLAPLCAGVWTAGRIVASRDLVARELAERSRELERQRERTAELAVEVERTRLAADLDAAARRRVADIVALAARGERDADESPARAREAFARIERQGRESLNEMRDLLGVLRSDQPAPRAPRPTLGELERLLAGARAGGRVVELGVDGEPRALPDGVELAAYRIVQHALEVVDAGPLAVRLRYEPDALALEVSGRGDEPRHDIEGALAAARERVAARGGQFTVEAPAPGRTVLRARLPVAA
jgi:signal transduction histidine kinase